MSDDQPKPKSEADAALEREIRDGRKFSLAEAIGRLAGPGMMKGVSPATGKQQAAAQIESYLERNLPDSCGALSAVLLRQVTESDLLLANLDQPLVTLAGFVERVLGSDFLLQELIREADVEWGRVFGERPYFQKEGCPPHQDDPYTVESVRGTMTALLGALTRGEASE
jgi:broad specificity phosphatase PhoE